MANNAFPFRIPRQLRGFLVCQIVTAILVLYLWMRYNGGLLPKFLKHRMPEILTGPDINVLWYFPDAKNDGSQIRWSHAVNSEEDMTIALKSKQMIWMQVNWRKYVVVSARVPGWADVRPNHSEGPVHMIEADVILKGQGTEVQKLVPIMAQPPASDSDLSLEIFLNKIKRSSKGFKLDFKSIDAVEISLQRVKEENQKAELKMPIWLHADVLQGPNGGDPNIDATRFFRIQSRMFPKATMSLGWTTESHTDTSQTGYTWEMVMDMYDLVKKWFDKLENPLIFSVRLMYTRNSVTQLKWLCDNTRAGLLVWDYPDDSYSNEDLMYLSYRFPPERLFFDLSREPARNYVHQYRHYSRDHVSKDVLNRDVVMFKAEGWVKMGLFIDEGSILPGTEALVLASRAVYVLSRQKYKPHELLTLHGRVHFLNRKKVELARGETGLNIYIRPSAYADFEKIVGIRCFIGADGDLRVTESHLKHRDFKSMSHGITATFASCFRFSVTDTGTEIIFRVNTLHDCDTLHSVNPDTEYHAELKVPIPKTLGREENPFILKLEDSKRTAVIDELSIQLH